MSAQRASQLVEAGLWLRLSGDHEGAKRLFEQALKLDPANARARQLLDSPPVAPAQPTAAAKKTGELDWGHATGGKPTPPPIAPVEQPIIKSSNTRPFGQPAPLDTHTIRLGDTPVPEVPEAPRFEDPHGEVMITGADDPPADNSTLVFGRSGIPVPPSVSTGAPPGGTMVFAGKNLAPPAVPPVAPVGGGTLVFGSRDAGPQPPAPGQGSRQGAGTMVFGSTGGDAPVPSQQPQRQQGGTMVFAGKGNAPPPVAPVGGPPNSTMVFGSQSSTPPPIAPVTEPRGSGTMAFGSAPQASPREQAVVTEPGLPEFAVDDFAQLEEPPRPTTGTLSFNFDDMVAEEPPPPGPIPSPPVPYDKEDAPQTAWDRSNPRIDISKIEPGEGGGFDIISSDSPPPVTARSPAQLRQEVSTLLSGAKDLLDLDDHSGAMELIGKALELDPTDSAALKLKDRSERTLVAMYESKLGDLNQIPTVKLKDDEIIWLNLDHRAGFVLAQIDGSVSFEEIFAVSGMSRLDTARILAQLVEEGVITKV